MKVTKMEVKTIYNIEVSFDDFINAKKAWTKNKDSLQILCPQAFENDDLTVNTVMQEMRNHISCSGQRANLLARYFKFDGWENAGYYHREKEVIRMSVYMNGDNINP
jgi:hypothetical protein